jgi:hypothetical protein
MYNITFWNQEENLDDNDFYNNYSALYKQKIIQEKFSRYNIPFSEKIIDSDRINATDLNIFVLEIKYLNVFSGTLQKQFTNSSLNFIRKNNLKILLHYAKEGFELDNHIEIIYKELKNANLLDNEIFLIFGDRDCIDNYHENIRKNNLPNFLEKVFYVNFFESHYLDTLSDLQEDIKKHNNDIFEKQKDYLFYNGKIRTHRLLAHYEIKKRKLDKFGYISFIGDTHVPSEYNLEFYKNHIENLKLLDSDLEMYLKNWSPLVLDKDPLDFTYENQNQTFKEHYKHSFLSLVSEMSITTRFYTEKIYKPLLNGHPFLVLAGKGFLEGLRTDGYMTFPEIFDESYDKENDPVKRLYMVIDELENFCSKSIRNKKTQIGLCNEKLEHNRNNFLKRAKNSLAKQYKTIMDDINESRH